MEETVLAASSLHLPLIEGRSFLNDSHGDNRSELTSKDRNGKGKGNGEKKTEHDSAGQDLLISLKHCTAHSIIKETKNGKLSEKNGKRQSKKIGSSKSPNRTKSKSASSTKKSRQKASINDDLDSAILRGVTMRPSGKWQAQLYYAGKSRYIGVFDTREKAAKAYEIAREKLKSNSNPNEASQSQEETESAVAAARKAAFDAIKNRI